MPVAITASYLAASGLSYLLNRALNFRSHGAVGPQAGVYAVVIAVNYLALILGVGAGLAALGVNYQLARVAAGRLRGRVHVRAPCAGSCSATAAPRRAQIRARACSGRARTG